jgi:oxygen-independent coproporphyrinogen-3 oxidase
MTIPLSLYIHFPWCVKKCPYCDFNSYELGDKNLEDVYIQALKDDLEIEAQLQGKKRELHSIFMGGGTPSLFSSNAIAKVLSGIDRIFTINGDTEITLEANPGTLKLSLDNEKFQGFFDAGVNRISIGVQSFNDRHLQSLGRIHSGRDAHNAFYAAREAGFTNINLDLMHGLPDQNADEAMQDLDTAISLGSEHLSWYQLTIERNTYFHKYPPLLPDDDRLWDITEKGLSLLAANDFKRYEISAFAKLGYECKHNNNYWSFGDYLGVGAGAHGKISRSHEGHFEIYRTTKTRSPTDYLASPNRQQSLIQADSMVLEFLMNALRLNSGFSPSLFEQRTGLSFDSIAGFVTRGIERKLLQSRDSSDLVIPTELGTRYLDDLLLLTD